MTTIAYKNGILAGDKMTTDGGMPMRTTKVLKCGKWLVGGAGDTARIHEMHEWIEAGMDPKTLPAFQRDVGTCVIFLMVNEAGELYLLENSHIPYKLEQPFHAIGSGRDLAIMAMHLGKSAPEAVHLASRWDRKTGDEVDTVTIPQPLEAWRITRLESVHSLSGGSLLQRQQQQEPGGRVPGRA